MRILKEATIKVIKLRILRVKKLVVKGVEAKPKILTEEDIWADSIVKQII